jgi:ribulose-5-phosphate 4-epimerase/fuculose-1-phosphate aldolase
VCHTHPTNTLKILCSDNIYDFSVYRLFPDQVIFNDKKSCVIPYANPGEELFKHIEDIVNKFIESEKFFPKLILLKNHGIITCGKTIEECVVATEICEKSAEIFLSGVDKMNMTYLSDLDINKLINDENEKYRKSLI